MPGGRADATPYAGSCIPPGFGGMISLTIQPQRCAQLEHRVAGRARAVQQSFALEMEACVEASRNVPQTVKAAAGRPGISFQQQAWSGRNPDSFARQCASSRPRVYTYGREREQAAQQGRIRFVHASKAANLLPQNTG